MRGVAGPFLVLQRQTGRRKRGAQQVLEGRTGVKCAQGVRQVQGQFRRALHTVAELIHVDVVTRSWIGPATQPVQPRRDDDGVGQSLQGGQRRRGDAIFDPGQHADRQAGGSGQIGHRLALLAAQGADFAASRLCSAMSRTRCGSWAKPGSGSGMSTLGENTVGYVHHKEGLPTGNGLLPSNRKMARLRSRSLTARRRLIGAWAREAQLARSLR